MIKKIKILCVSGIFLTFSLYANTVFAVAAWSWIAESAMAKFTPEDLSLLKNAAKEALNNQPDDSEVQWDNPDTEHSGSITVSNTRQINEKTCRNALLKNTAKSIKGTVHYILCKQSDDKWQIYYPNQ
jgi:surface antigen